MFFLYFITSMEEQTVLLQQNTERDELLSRQTAANHRELEKELAIMTQLLHSHDRIISEDCVQKNAFSEVGTSYLLPNVTVQLHLFRCSNVARLLEY